MLSCCFLLRVTLAGTYMNSVDYKISVKRLQMIFEVFLCGTVSAGFRLFISWDYGGLGLALSPSFQRWVLLGKIPKLFILWKLLAK